LERKEGTCGYDVKAWIVARSTLTFNLKFSLISVELK
jgi:hypothetical protein